MVNQINDRIGKVRFGNVRPSYDFRIRKTIDVDGEEKEVSITSAFYKKYRYDNDIKAEVVPYTENDEEKCLLVIYDDGYTTDILENNEHKSYKLPGVNLDNIDEIKDVFFEQLDIALDREVHKEEVKEQEPEVIEETVEKVEEPKPVMTDADDVLLEGTAPEEEEKDHPVMTDGDDVLMEVPIADEDKKPVITDATDVLIEGGEVKEDKVEEESEVVESVDGVIEEVPEEIVEEEKEETVPVAKEDLPKERLEFISNDLFKNLTLTDIEETKKQMAEDLRSLTREEVEAIQNAAEYNDEEKEDIKENDESNTETSEEIESEELDAVPMNEIKEYDHRDDELGSDNPMIVDRSDEIPEEIKEQRIKEDKELRKNKHFKEDKEDRDDR